MTATTTAAAKSELTELEALHRFIDAIAAAAAVDGGGPPPALALPIIMRSLRDQLGKAHAQLAEVTGHRDSLDVYLRDARSERDALRKQVGELEPWLNEIAAERDYLKRSYDETYAELRRARGRLYEVARDRDGLLKELRSIHADRQSSAPKNVETWIGVKPPGPLTNAPTESAPAPPPAPKPGATFLDALWSGRPIRRARVVDGLGAATHAGPWIAIGHKGGETPFIRIDTGAEVTLAAEDYLATDWAVMP